jgi:hypothetical protein
LPADGPQLHDCAISISSLVNQRVVVAEVFEWQGRHMEAIRCASSLMLTHNARSRSHFLLFNLAASQQLTYKTASTSSLRRRCVQDGCLADATLRLESIPSRCQHPMRLSNWRGTGATCCQRR